jgi:hypothetical protein
LPLIDYKVTKGFRFHDPIPSTSTPAVTATSMLAQKTTLANFMLID